VELDGVHTCYLCSKVLRIKGEDTAFLKWGGFARSFLCLLFFEGAE
jgi:hypothetical protein